MYGVGDADSATCQACAVRIGILGPLQVWDNTGRPVEIGGGRPRTLLARLALDPGRVVNADALVDALWEDEPPSGVANALQTVVSRLRRSLQGGVDGASASPVIESRHAGYVLAVDTRDVDVTRFEEHARAGREALLAGDAATAHAALTEALSLWRGPMLSDLGDAPFVGTAAARFEETRLSVVEDRHDAALLLGWHLDVVPELEALAREHPLRERVCGLLIRALAASGRQAEAVQLYERTRNTLAEELGIDPSAELQNIHLALLRGELAAAPPGAEVGEIRSGPATGAAPLAKAALPAPRTSFVGRDADVEGLTTALDQARMLTLHGPGGAGKTRLALEFARHLADHASSAGADGVWFVELAGVGDPQEVGPAVLSVLGLGEASAATVEGLRERMPLVREAGKRLADALRDKNSVVVLDNCEHVIGSVAALADSLLAACPKLRLVATSREPLGVEGEQLYPVGPLELPDGNEDLTPEHARTFAAVRLFTDRAAAVLPGFQVDESNVGPVVEACRRLDGMPLAIELAAARVRALTPAQISDRLDDRFRLLTNGGRTALPRQQTLRAVVEWSWELLEKPERILLRRLAVFSGGASLDAIEQICSGDGVDVEDTLDTVASLVDKSLVEAGSDTAGREVRYRLLETVRAYAAERLDHAGERSGLADRHAAYYRDLLERADPYLRRAEQLEWMARLTEDYENLISALRWAIQQGQADLAVRIAAVMGYYWMLRGGRRESGVWLQETLALPGAEPTSRRALVHLFDCANIMGDGDARHGVRSLARARRVCRRCEPDPAFPVHTLVETLWLAGIDGRPHARARLAAMPVPTDAWTRGVVHTAGVFMAVSDGDIETRDREIELAMESFGAAGDRMGMALIQRSRASYLAASGDHGAAARALEEALRMTRELGTVDDLPPLLAELAQNYADLGDHASARRFLEQAHAEACRSGAIEASFAVHMAQAWLSHREGEHEAAIHALDRATAAMGSPNAVDMALWMSIWPLHAEVQISLGDLDAAEQALRSGVDLALDGSSRARAGAPDRAGLAGLTQAWASLAVARGQYEQAAQLLGITTLVRGEPDLGSPERAAADRQARRALGDDEFERVYNTGATLEITAAVLRIRDMAGLAGPALGDRQEAGVPD
nr:BTAD domain-containing putative transcriptional regulator [Phytoactinopolyspora mesophila]